jgi:hypothetical protein
MVPLVRRQTMFSGLEFTSSSSTLQTPTSVSWLIFYCEIGASGGQTQTQYNFVAMVA